MAEKVNIWFDPEGDYLEVRFSQAPGFMRPTAHDAVMERVDEHGMCWGLVSSASAVFEKVGHWKPN
jgi:hypothetical protein